MVLRSAALVAAGAVIVLIGGCGGGAGDPSSAPETSPVTDTSPIEGSYTLEWPPEELAAALIEVGEDPAVAERDGENNSGTIEIDIGDGRWGQRWITGPAEGDVCDATYVIDGDRITVTAETDIAVWDCGSENMGELIMDATWTLEGDELTFTDFELPNEPDMTWWMSLYFGTRPLVRATGEGSPDAAGQADSLTLSRVSRFADAQVAAFAAEVEQLTDGRVTVAVVDPASPLNTAEQDILRDVASGELDLGWVGARAFAGLGVTSFDALIAPMLLDGMAVQQAVLDSELPVDMLAGLEPLRVSGLAVIGGDLRRPIGVDGPLVRADDFAGITFHTTTGTAAVEELGAVAVSLPAQDRNARLEDGSIDGYENTLLFYKETQVPPGAHVTVNVALWPSVGVLVANPARLSDLTTAHRAALLQAAATTAAQSTEIAAHDQAVLERICADGGHLAVASADDIASLRAAVQPSYDRLARDPESAAHLAAIEQIKAATPPDPALDVPANCT